MNGLLRPGEAAARLGVTTTTLGRYVDEGLLTVERKGRGMRWYREREVELLADARHKDHHIAELEHRLAVATASNDALSRAITTAHAYLQRERTP